MRTPIYFFGLILFIGFKAACTSQIETPSLLQEARYLAESHPDSAMRLIDAIVDPEGSLNKKQYMQYLVTRVQVRHKNYRDITEDTLIFDAARYFRQHNKDLKQTALALFYSGSVRRQQKQYEPAMVYYKEAEHYAKKAKDNSLRGLVEYNIGDLLAEQGLHYKALDRYRTAARYYQDELDKLAYSYSAMGRMFLFEEDNDSAFYYFHRGLDIAREKGSKVLQSQLAQSLGVAYGEVKRYNEAERYHREAMQLTSDSTELPRNYLNLAKLYSKMPQADSASVYAEKLKEGLDRLKDNYFQASACNFLAGWEKAQGNYDSAFAHQDKRMKVLAQIMEDRGNQSVYEVEQKYNYERIQAQHYRAQSVKQRWIIVLLGIVIIGGVLFLWFWIRQKNKQIAVQQSMDTLTEMNRDLENTVLKKRLALRRALLWRFDIAKKVLKLNEGVRMNPKNTLEKSIIAQFNNIVYGETTIDEHWEALLQTFKNSRPGYAEKIRENYTDLTETEFRICILTYADFSVKEIAVVLQQSPNTIQTRRTTLRKKLGLHSGGDIAEHIDNILR
ncbi:tetratricopeptide repeat protein [Sphingobacterium haloxyli]|nr:LuxR C-terminal-related transcriptional regulator [Sphingobacterium haloxyli]